MIFIEQSNQLHMSFCHTSQTCDNFKIYKGLLTNVCFVGGGVNVGGVWFYCKSPFHKRLGWPFYPMWNYMVWDYYPIEISPTRWTGNS